MEKVENNFLKVSQQTLWQLIGKFVTSASTLIILSLISRAFGESGMGIFTLVLAYLGFFIIAVDLGLNAYLMPQIIQATSDLVWRKLFGLRILIAFFLIIVASIGIFFASGYDPLIFKLVLIGVVGALLQPAFFITSNAIFQAKLRYDLSIISSSLGSLLTLFLVFLAVSKNSSLQFIMLAYLIGWLFTALLALILVSKFIKNLFPLFDLQFNQKVLKGVWPVSLTLLLNVFYFRVDTFLLSFFKPLADVGVYNLSYSLFQTALVLPTFIMNSFYPLMIGLFNEDKKVFLKHLRVAVIGMLLLGSLGILGTFIFGEMVISTITGGRGFMGSADSLKILSLGFPAYFISALLMWVLVVMKRYYAMVIIYLLGLIFNLFTNLIFIPSYSFIATSWITGISEYLVLILQLMVLFLLKKNLRWN